MKFKILVLFGALLTNVKIFAQTDFRPGYIINISGDTIFGEIDYQGDLLMRKICRFRSDKNNILEYSPNEISAYRIIDSKYYVSREINHERYFLEFLIKGQINIYYMRDKEGIHYFLDKKDVKLTEIPYEEHYKYVDNKEMLFKSTYHINLLRFYMQDDTLSQARIQQISKPNHENLIKLAQDYHNSVCPDERCIVYKKKQPLIKVNIEALSGVINLVNNEELNDKYYLQSGIIAHFEMPGTNEKIFFETGVIISQSGLYEENKRYFEFPIQIGYLAPKTYLIRPSVSIGLISPSYSGGFALRIHEKIYLGIQSRVNFSYSKIPWNPEKLNSYSILGSLYIDL